MINYDLIGRILAHPVQIRVLEKMVELEGASPDRVRVSPKELAVLFGESDVSTVAYHVKALAGGTPHVIAKRSKFAEMPFLELVDTAQRRGATEHYYSLTPAATIAEALPEPALA